MSHTSTKPCECGRQSLYGKKCRECHEDELRREARDALDNDPSVRAKKMLHKERCRVRLPINYDGDGRK